MIRFILALFVIAALTGCKQAAPNERISVVAAIFPMYDWTSQIAGGNVGGMDLTLLLDNRIDLHNYQPSVDDIVKISVCDLFIYTGGESDGWADDVLKEAVNKDMVVINLLDALGRMAKIEEVKPGMAAPEEEAELDEHVWLSLKNAQVFCRAIADALYGLDPVNASIYQNNLDAYIKKLSALDADYQTAVNAAAVKTLLFGDRFPFRYLTDNYGLDYYAAFAGCSAETEASFDTIVFLANKIDELSLKNIMVTESCDQLIAKTIRDNTAEKNQQVLMINAMQSVTNNDIQNGITYLSIMEDNLSILKEALK